MGCDAHIYVEVKKNGQWKKVGKVFPNPYYRPAEKKETYNKPKTDQPYSGRNYDLFAILANVRNGRGFAGSDTGDGFIPIDMPRDLPKNVSKTIKDISDEWGVDGHSHSYFTLRELNEYDWNRETKHRGFVGVAEYNEFKAEGSPSGWCTMIDGKDIKKVSNSAFEKVVKLNPPDIKNYYTQVEWTVAYKDAIGKYWFEKTIPALTKLSKNPDDVRIVFWFDN
jgi:hypothetical protein